MYLEFEMRTPRARALLHACTASSLPIASGASWFGRRRSRRGGPPRRLVPRCTTRTRRPRALRCRIASPSSCGWPGGREPGTGWRTRSPATEPGRRRACTPGRSASRRRGRAEATGVEDLGRHPGKVRERSDPGSFAPGLTQEDRGAQASVQYDAEFHKCTTRIWA